MNILYIFVEIIKKSITMKNLISTIVFVLGSLVSIGQYVPPKIIKTTYVDATEVEKNVLDEVNRQRKLHGLRPCVFCPIAKEMAKYHTIYLSNYNADLSHDEPTDYENFVELTFEQRRDKYLKGKYVGECAQGGSIDNFNNESNWNVVVSKEIVTSWMNSPPHRAIILNPIYRFFAVSILDVTYHTDKGREIKGSCPVLVLYK